MRIRRKFAVRFLLVSGIVILTVGIVAFFYPQPGIGLPVIPAELDYSGNSYLIWPFGASGGSHPEGHPGIDFSWNSSGQVVAATDGIVFAISDNPSHPGVKTVTMNPVGNPFLILNYDELVNLSAAVMPGATIARGQFIGRASQVGPDFFMIHFAITRVISLFFIGPVAPEPYFDDAARAMLGHSIWDSGTLMNKSAYSERDQFPYLSNDVSAGLYMTNSYAWLVDPIVLGLLALGFFVTNAVLNRVRPINRRQ